MPEGGLLPTPPERDDLEARLTDLGRALVYPTVSPALAARVGERIRHRETRMGSRWPGMCRAPIRRALLVAVVLLLLGAVAAVAASIVLPGLRVVFAPASGSASPAVSPGTVASQRGTAGLRLGLGERVTIEAAREAAGFEPLVPPDLGDPDEVWLRDGRITLLWSPRAELPATTDGVGLLATEFRGDVDPGWYEKVIYDRGTTIEAVRVSGVAGHWIEGQPHELVYRDASGRFVEETRRVVGDVLIWSRDGLTLRIESALGQDVTIDLAESLGPGP